MLSDASIEDLAKEVSALTRYVAALERAIRDLIVALDRDDWRKGSIS